MKRLLILLAVLACVSVASAQTTGSATSVAPATQAVGDTTNDFLLFIREPNPGAPTVALAGAGAGNVDNGVHRVRVEFTTAAGHSAPGAVSATVTVTDKTVNGQVALTSIPTGSSFVTGRKVYMTRAGGSTYYLLSNGTIANNSATTLTANDTDATLLASTVIPSGNTTKNQIVGYDGPTGAVTIAGSAVTTPPGGSNTQVQFNDSSAFGGDAGLTYNKTTDALTVTGNVSSSGSFVAGAGANAGFYILGRSALQSTVDGNFIMTNNAGTSFNFLAFGGGTASFPLLKRNGTSLEVRLGDDSAAAPLTASIGTFSTSTISPLFRSTTAKVLVQGTGTGATQLSATQTTVPTCTTNCGTSPSVAGTDTFMRVTMGATGSPASGWVVQFNGTWAAAPVCVAEMAKAGMVAGKQILTIVTTTTTATFVTNGTAPATADVYNVICGGTQ